MGEYSAYTMFRPTDLYNVPLCLGILFILTARMWKRYKGSELQRYIFPAVSLRFVFAVIYVLVLVYYYGVGDSFNYYQGVLDMHHAVDDGNESLISILSMPHLDKNSTLYTYFYNSDSWAIRYYMMEPRSFTVSKFALPFSLMFGKSFLCISFCISYLAFLGAWRILKMFHSLYPHLHRQLAISILFLPSLLFWGVSLLKDPMCIAAMGFFVYAMYQALIAKQRLVVSLVTILIAGYVLLELKPYILVSISSVFGIWLFLQLRDRIQEPALRNFSTGLFMVMAAGLGFFAVQTLSSLDENSQFSADQILNSIQSQQATFAANTEEEGGNSNFSLGASDGGSAFGTLMLLPQGVVNTYFRPFLWEVRSPMMIFSALEAAAFLALTLLCFFKVGIGKTFLTIWSDPVIAFCFVFAIIFGSVIGITSVNFGALVRYKLPCISFYAVAFLLIMNRHGKLPDKYIFHRKLF